MTTWAAMSADVLSDMPGCSQPLAEQSVRDAGIEFCNRTHIHIVDLPAINAVAGTANYTLTSNVSGTEVCGVRAAWYDTTPLDIAPLDILSEVYPDWRDRSDKPFAYTMYDETTMTLFPKPLVSLTAGLKVQVALRPTLASTALTDWIATKFWQEITAGARARLFAIPNKSWSNAAYVAPNRARFMYGISSAVAAVNHSHARAALSVRMCPAA